MPSQDCARSAQDSAALERYLISPSRITKLKKIGRGGCGVVYSGTYAKDDRDPPVSVRCSQYVENSWICALSVQGEKFFQLTFEPWELLYSETPYQQQVTSACCHNIYCIQVALKVLNVDTEVTGQTLLPFDNEVRMLERASSQCEHVCRFYGISSLEDQPCIVMKLYSRTLAAELEAASGDDRLSP